MRALRTIALSFLLVILTVTSGWAQKPVVAEITQRDGAKEYKVIGQDEFKELEKDILFENDAMPYAYIRTQVYWRTNIMSYPVSARGSNNKPAPKVNEDGKEITFEFPRPDLKAARICGIYDDEGAAAAKVAMFADQETQRREKAKKEEEVRKSRMSPKKIASLAASEAAQKELRAWCDAQIDIIKGLMKKGKFNADRELLYNWQGQPITKPSIPRRVGDSLDAGRENIVNTKRLSKRPTRMVNTFKARKEAEKRAAEQAEYIPSQ